MLSNKFRFHGHASLKFVFGRGRTYRFKVLSVRVAQNPRREHSRASVVISKKVVKASPKRNLVRRRIYEILRTNWDNILPGYDILISVYDPNVLELNHEQLLAEITHALQTSRVWR